MTSSQVLLLDHSSAADDEDDGDDEGGDDEGNTDDGDFSRDRSSCSKSRGGYTAVGRSTNSDTSKVPARYLREILNS